MGELDPLPRAEEVDGVVAYDVAAADGEDADLLGPARTDVALAPVDAGEPAPDVAHGSPEALGGTARSVDLGAVVRLDDLHVKAKTELRYSDLCELGEHLHADARVRRPEDGH